MSTSFHVYPTKESIPTFRELIDVAMVHLRELLASWGFNQTVPLTVTLWRTESDRTSVPAELDSPFWWPWKGYATFVVPPVGATIAHAHSVDDIDREYIEDILLKQAPQFADRASAFLRVGRSWNFVKHAGQPSIIYAAYGMLAGSLAELTDGFIDSGDCAWDSERLPALPSAFLSAYGRPDPNGSEKHRDWEKYFLERLRQELSEIQSAQ